MDSTNRSELGGVDDAEKDLKPDNFDASDDNAPVAPDAIGNEIADVNVSDDVVSDNSNHTDSSKDATVDTASNEGVSDDGTTLKISHGDVSEEVDNTESQDIAPETKAINSDDTPKTESTSASGQTNEVTSAPTEQTNTPQPADPTPNVNLTPPAGIPTNPFARPAPSVAPTQPIMSQQLQFASSQGDIILQTNQPPKKSKKPFIVAAVLGIVILGSVIAVFMFLIKNPGSPIASSFTKAQPSFNWYANYLLYEKDSNENLTNEYSRSANYAINYILYNAATSYKQQFFNTASQRLDDFKNEAKNIDANDLQRKLQDYSEHFDFIKLYASSMIMTQSDIVKKYQTENASFEKINNEIQNTYANFIQSSSQYAQKYGKNSIAYLGYLNQVYNNIRVNGCTDVNSACAKETMNQIQIPQYTEPEQLYNSSRQAVVQQCWDIKKELGET